ncbi:peptide chain release factor 1 [Candidatus Nomurabacteria bacterium]|nr:peptide chain release factor 1 [Candidatus Nomurabacteria bacterium]
MNEKINKIKEELKTIEAELQDPSIVSDSKKMAVLGKKYNQLKEIIRLADQQDKLEKDLSEAKSILANESNEEMLALTEEEILDLEQRLEKNKLDLEDLLSPADPNDHKNIILEIRAGTGGDESSLFAADLFRMYSRFAETMNFKINILSQSRNEIGGFKEIIAEISGENVYKYFKFESGVHRVQRVPETEKAGRVHTSAATVAVMPEAEEIDLVIEAKDLRLDTFCASGNGGQSVNTTYSAVRITHLPTNTVVSCQDEKSQTQNRLKAMQILRSRILANLEAQKQAELSATRKSQVGSGDRSEKIRTYNFPQDRLTDHRIKLTVHNLSNILEGNLLPIIQELQKANRQNA